jgi:O-antigen ligase
MTGILSNKTLLVAFATLGSLFQCIAVGPANALMGAFYFFAVIALFKNKERIAQVFTDNRNLVLAFLFFCICQLPATFYAGDGRAWSQFFSLYIVRTLPLFAVLLTLNEKRSAFIVLFFGVIASYLIDTAASPFLGFKWGRLHGIYGHFMIYAGFACIVLPALVTAFVYSRTKLQKLVWGVLNIGCFAVLFLNGARGAWLGVALACLTLFLLNLKRLRIILPFIAVLAVAAVVLGLNFTELANRASTVTTVHNSLNSERLLMWQSAWNMFMDHPFTGVGLGNYPDAYTYTYMLPQAVERDLTRAHSNIFELLGENGIFGLIGFLVFFGYVSVATLKRYLTTKNVFALLIFLSTAALMTQGLTEYNLAHSNLMKFFWTYVGCCWILMGLTDKESVSCLTSPVSFLKT